MPITLKIVDHPATAFDKSKKSSAEQLLRDAAPRQAKDSKGLVQTSFVPSQFETGHIGASKNGFVWAAYHAYNHHHHLRIRPEDVWFAILTQISFYINANAEELRSFFVAHEGKKKLEAVSYVADFAALAVQMGDILGNNVNDPELKDWVLPSFSTTTHSDKVVGSILFMGAMQKYFDFYMTVMCGLPSVTLLGIVEDWEDILARLDKLDLFGDEPKKFAAMLRPILRRMVLSFSEPTAAEVVDFWNTIVKHNSRGSGSDYLSGWLTAFCFWDEEGKAKYTGGQLLDGVGYPIVDVEKITAGFASVPVSVDDKGYKYKARMVAGSVGILATSSETREAEERPRAALDSSATVQGEPASLGGHGTPIEAGGDEKVVSDRQPGEPGPGQGEPILDTVQPVSGWWMFRVGE